MKKIVSLTKKELSQLVSESVKRIISESREFEDLDISQIPLEDLEQGYRDLRLSPTLTMHGDRLSDIMTVKEAVGDTLQPDDLAKRIIDKYDLPQSFVVVKEKHHKICVYVITAILGINSKMIERDMQKAGYFVGYRQKPQNIKGMKFQVVQYEPESQLQQDVTDEVKEKYDFLYHLTPYANVESILQKGLIPQHRNKFFSFPPRTYLINGDASNRDILALGQGLCTINKNKGNNGEYALLRISINNLDDIIRFFYDPNSQIGIYTEQNIPKDNIEFVNKLQFITNLKYK